jgi:hypothetical protein
MARKIGKIGKKITPEIDRVFNSHLQGKNDEKSALYSSWWALISQALTDYKKDMKEELRDMLAT